MRSDRPTPPPRWLLAPPFLVLALAAAACGTAEQSLPSDTGSDAVDTGGGDTASDTAPDAPSDTAPDAPDDGTDALDTAPTDTIPADAADGDAADTSPCTTPNPAGCRNQGCPDLQVCWTDFWPGLSCTPSACECDAETGAWLCTEDCGGGECVPAPGAACAEDADCTLGAQWCEDGVCEPCNNNSVLCDIACEHGLLVRNGCHPCECAPPPVTPCGPSPQTGCVTDGDCVAGESCEPSALAVCLPSSCVCDEPSGAWACTDDCLGSACQPIGGACEGRNPQGCRSTGCDDGFECVTGDEAICIPSSCSCDEETGRWTCTEDCGGGVCVPEGSEACASDADCAEGTHWCEDNACVECDNSGMLCRIRCPEGTELHRRNGCTPCECVPVNACTADEECEPWQRCEPGDLCLSWCAEGDPACCYGNRCADLPD